jgi:ABC-type branched-subunit amino acid transport system ATPase component
MGVYRQPDRRKAVADILRMQVRFPIVRECRHSLEPAQRRGAANAGGRARRQSKPRLLLLVEPSLGLSSKMTDLIFGMIASLPAQRRRGGAGARLDQ